MKHPCKRFFSAILVLISCLLEPFAARPTTLIQLSLAQLTSAASSIVVAECTGVQTLWRDGEIWTATSFRAEEVWKGELPKEFQVWILGGSSGAMTSYVPGAPRFRRDEEAVIFLETTRSGFLSITAWGEGTFRLRRDPLTGVSRVTQDTASVPVFQNAARQFRSEGIRDFPLEELKSRIFAIESRESTQRRKK